MCTKNNTQSVVNGALRNTGTEQNKMESTECAGIKRNDTGIKWNDTGIYRDEAE